VDQSKIAGTGNFEKMINELFSVKSIPFRDFKSETCSAKILNSIPDFY
jgi:hypothetical protein